MSSYRRGKINRWVNLLLVVVVAFPLLAISLLGPQLHRILARMAGEVIGEIKDNLGVVAVGSALCVVGVWVFIMVKCWAEGRDADGAESDEQSSEQS